MIIFVCGFAPKKTGGKAVIFAPFLVHHAETADISILWPLSFCFLQKEFANGFYSNNKYLKYHSTRNCCMWEALMIAIAAVLNKLELILAVQFGFLAFRAKFE